MNITTTERGFEFAEFYDRYNQKCSLQKSSLVAEDCIWFGVDNADPKIMARDAAKYGIETEEDSGWVTFPIPSEVLLSTRMHLTREKVANLIPILQNFVDTGELK